MGEIGFGGFTVSPAAAGTRDQRLPLAALFGHLEIVKYLHVSGATLASKPGVAFEGSPLNAAAGRGYVDVVDYLLSTCRVAGCGPVARARR